MPWSNVKTPTSLPWWMWLRLMIGLPWFFTHIPARALFEISLSSYIPWRTNKIALRLLTFSHLCYTLSYFWLRLTNSLTLYVKRQVSINYHNSLRIEKDDAVQLDTVLMNNNTVAVKCQCNTSPICVSVYYLCMVSDVKTNVFTVTNVAVLDCRTSTLTTDTDSWPHWNKQDGFTIRQYPKC